jgi:hypothetical protein
MSDIQDYIQKLGDDSLSFEEQAAALQQIEQSLLESQAQQEEVVQSSTDLVVEAVKSIEETIYTQFKELSTSQSMKGPKGDKGLDGKNGKDGIGRDGKDGKDGKDGVDGIDGEDGRYITDVEIDIDDTLLVTLSDNSTIKTTKEIKGPKGDMGPQGLRGSNGNGVVVGGTTGQVLAKASNTDYDVQWTSTPGIDLGSPDAIGDVTPNTGKFTTLEATGTTTLGTTSTTYVTITGDASYPMVKATGGTNTPLVLSPLGTGALQAQKTDSSATGGNARGANAVDWSTYRTSASQVASGITATIGGGQQNTTSGAYAVIAGGRNNNIGQNDSVIAGGNGNNITASSTKAGAILGGINNQAYGFYNVIGGGYTNAGTSQTAVTTNTTTIAVTAGTTLYLSSTNASIKVGQYVTGTGVSGETYATSTVTTGTAAVMNTSTISGTTLTVGSLASGTIIAGQRLTGTGITAGTYIVSGSGLSWVVNVSQTVASTTITGTAYTFTISQAATTAAGVTLSFYTPHGVVVGGGNNQATGAYSFIGGGGDAGTAANRNVASGDWSVVGGGSGNTASGRYAVVGGGGVFGACLASGQGSAILGGWANTASGQASVITGGNNNVANATNSTINGGSYSTTRSIEGNSVFASCVTPVSTTQGSSQAALLVLGRQTTDATATALTSNSGAASGTNQVILPNNSAYYFRGELIAGVTGGGDTKGWFIEGVIKRGANAASTAVVGTPTVTSSYADAGAATWTVTATANTTLGGLAITVTGQAATTIRWVAQIRTTEMTY